MTGGGRRCPFALGEDVFGDRDLGAGVVADLGQLLALGPRSREPLKRVFFVGGMDRTGGRAVLLQVLAVALDLRLGP